jgi:hypothetical protein
MISAMAPSIWLLAWTALGCSQLFSSTIAFSPSCSNGRPLLPRHADPAITRQVTAIQAAKDADNDINDNHKKSDLSWLREAMDIPSPLEPDGLVLREAKQGISGFAVDPLRGFVVVLVGGDRATDAVVSPQDKQQVRSAEALCLVQLAGGLDLGTPVLPPDLLARIVAEELDGDIDARELRRKVKLRRVNVIANQEEDTQKRESVVVPPPPQDSTPGREAAIQEQAPKVMAAVKKLPGLGDCTLEQVVEGMKAYADETGQVNREGFGDLLHTLRSQINFMEPSKVKFVLVVEYEGEELLIPSPSVVAGVGLALRYKVDVVVDEDCQMDGFDVVEIASRFPAFRPLKELEEDAKIMDGFIPAMFKEATAPDNEDKM